MSRPYKVTILDAISAARKVGPSCVAAEQLQCTEAVRNLHDENVVALVMSMSRGGWRDSEPAYGVASHDHIPALALFDVIAGNHRTTAAQILLLDETYIFDLKLESEFMKQHFSDVAIALQLWEPSPRSLGLMEQVQMISAARAALDLPQELSKVDQWPTLRQITAHLQSLSPAQTVTARQHFLFHGNAKKTYAGAKKLISSSCFSRLKELEGRVEEDFLKPSFLHYISKLHAKDADTRLQIVLGSAKPSTRKVNSVVRVTEKTWRARQSNAQSESSRRIGLNGEADNDLESLSNAGKRRAIDGFVTNVREGTKDDVVGGLVEQATEEFQHGAEAVCEGADSCTRSDVNGRELSFKLHDEAHVLNGIDQHCLLSKGSERLTEAAITFIASDVLPWYIPSSVHGPVLWAGNSYAHAEFFAGVTDRIGQGSADYTRMRSGEYDIVLMPVFDTGLKHWFLIAVGGMQSFLKYVEGLEENGSAESVSEVRLQIHVLDSIRRPKTAVARIRSRVAQLFLQILVPKLLAGTLEDGRGPRLQELKDIILQNIRGKIEDTRVMASTQTDSTSCGWHIILSSIRAVQALSARNATEFEMQGKSAHGASLESIQDLTARMVKARLESLRAPVLWELFLNLRERNSQQQTSTGELKRKQETAPTFLCENARDNEESTRTGAIVSDADAHAEVERPVTRSSKRIRRSNKMFSTKDFIKH
jgi:hypothetical protein